MRKLLAIIFFYFLTFASSAQLSLDVGPFIGTGINSSYGGKTYGLSSVWFERINADIGFGKNLDISTTQGNLSYRFEKMIPNLMVGIGYTKSNSSLVNKDGGQYAIEENQFLNFNLGFDFMFDPAVLGIQNAFISNMFYHLKFGGSYRIASNQNPINYLSGIYDSEIQNQLHNRFSNGFGFFVTISANFRVYKMWKKD